MKRREISNTEKFIKSFKKKVYVVLLWSKIITDIISKKFNSINIRGLEFLGSPVFCIALSSGLLLGKNKDTTKFNKNTNPIKIKANFP